MKAIEIEIAVATMDAFHFRRHLVVPNVSWGMFSHECDLIVVRKSGYAIEVEIKVSRADLKKDASKQHGHNSNLIKELYFAVPESLADFAAEHIPARAGLITVSKYEGRNIGFIKRHATPSLLSRQLTESEIYNVARLGTMRIWGLKTKLVKQMAN